jgi:hypothetical protein
MGIDKDIWRPMSIYISALGIANILYQFEGIDWDSQLWFFQPKTKHPTGAASRPEGTANFSNPGGWGHEATNMRTQVGKIGEI